MTDTGKSCETPEQDPWQVVRAFQQLENPTERDVFEFDTAVVKISRPIFKKFGYSRRVPPRKYEHPELGPHEELSILREYQRVLLWHLNQVETKIQHKTNALQSSCQHKWERDLSDRGHRSHYECHLCGAYR